MNYEGAPGLEFGGGNTDVDPNVAKGMSNTVIANAVVVREE
jgi:hypothetical protein